MKNFRSILAFVAILAASVVGVVQFGRFEVDRLRTQVSQLEQEKVQLREFAARLSASRRAAQINVTKQRKNDLGQPVFTLTWQEIARDGVLGQPATFDITGSVAYFEALTIKFEHDLVGKGDVGRGETLVMYRRAFGDLQSPQSGPTLAQNALPSREGDSTAAAPHELWQRFWELVDDSATQSRYGVRVAQIEAPAVPVKVGQVWELTIDAAGGLNLRKIGSLGSAPVPGNEK